MCFRFGTRSVPTTLVFLFRHAERAYFYEMNPFYFVSNIGELYVPAEYRDIVFARPRVKLFAHQELGHLNRIFTHIRHGGVAVVEGEWEQILVLMEYIQRHKQDLVQQS